MLNNQPTWWQKLGAHFCAKGKLYFYSISCFSFRGPFGHFFSCPYLSKWRSVIGNGNREKIFRARNFLRPWKRSKNSAKVVAKKSAKIRWILATYSGQGMVKCPSEAILSFANLNVEIQTWNDIVWLQQLVHYTSISLCSREISWGKRTQCNVVLHCSVTGRFCCCDVNKLESSISFCSLWYLLKKFFDSYINFLLRKSRYLQS